MPNKDRSFHEVPEKACGGVAVFRAAAEALSLQARHGDGPRAVGFHQDLQLRSATPAYAVTSQRRNINDAKSEFQDLFLC